MRKVVLIGIDGFDPAMAEQMMGEGALPGFSALRQRGGFGPLRTTNPALSPTAWSTMAIGGNPGRHGLFDFIGRDPGSYLPRLSVPRQNPRNFFGSRRSAFLPARKGIAFWSHATAHRVPSTVVKWPVSFPPEASAGRMLSGLGVPDIRGTQGRYTFYSTRPPRIDAPRGDVVRLSGRGPSVETVLIGPDGDTVPLALHIQSPDRLSLALQDRSVSLVLKQWSDWIPVTFRRFGFPPIEGIFRIYWESAEPELQLYATAIHMNPKSAPFPIAAPEDYARELAGSLGVFHTLGLPEETNGIVDGLLSEEAFLDLADRLSSEREALFEQEFSRFKEGLFVFVFDAVDRVQHAQWAGTGSASASQDIAKRIRVVQDHYRRLDCVIARAVKSLGDDDLMLVVSDHGFTSFDRALHINSWLRDQGLLVLRQGSHGLPLFENVDWKRTQAYALGFVSLFLNLQGREPSGVVASADASQLKERIARELKQWQDPATGQAVMHSVHESQAIYSGPELGQAPDLVLAPKAGYRISWQTGLGAAPERAVETNDRAWRADHIVDPAFVPGSLFSSRPLNLAEASVLDIAPTVLHGLGLQRPKDFEGRSLLRGDR